MTPHPPRPTAPSPSSPARACRTPFHATIRAREARRRVRFAFAATRRVRTRPLQQTFPGRQAHERLAGQQSSMDNDRHPRDHARAGEGGGRREVAMLEACQAAETSSGSADPQPQKLRQEGAGAKRCANAPALAGEWRPSTHQWEGCTPERPSPAREASHRSDRIDFSARCPIFSTREGDSRHHAGSFAYLHSLDRVGRLEHSNARARPVARRRPSRVIWGVTCKVQGPNVGPICALCPVPCARPQVPVSSTPEVMFEWRGAVVDCFLGWRRGGSPRTSISY